MLLKAMVVDDDASKLADVVAALKGLQGNVEITSATSAAAAKKALIKEAFDLLVLDIALPLYEGSPPAKTGGLDLLDQVLNRPIFKRPRHIVGLTAYDDVFETSAARFGNDLWTVMFYDRTSDLWIEQLQAKAMHIWASEKAQQGEITHSVDICVVTALNEPELTAILNIDWQWEQLPADTDATVYHRAFCKIKDGSTRTIVAARAPGMGMANAAVLATKMAIRFKPRCLVMCGICAGEESEMRYGDVIAANPSWDYGSGKHGVRDGKKIFEPHPQPLTLSTRVRGIVDRLALDNEALQKIRSGFQGNVPPTMLTVRVGPLASGAAVVADGDLVGPIREQQNRKLLGIDMEAYGVLAAAAEAPAPRPEGLVLKGVSDFASTDKDDRYRHYAAYTSARVFAALVERYNL